ncbi:hypothetical protein K457DRAFT_23336 [Linnemannia elongata AG-77]|uniref:Ndc10 domain-containing protein n=1 Tax=Linnemannia elongata AG-77 TaxID=1314771 RepID=A0A197JJB3_9FUNG|nr:hypothetical protein K457DRAFT_23336 [Linnemannia elongata AG-77]
MNSSTSPGKRPVGEGWVQGPAGAMRGSTMDQALNAIIHLQTRQSNRIINPNPAPHLRKSTAIKETLRKYNNDLVIGELVNHRNWSASCAVRNTYTIDEHIRCLLDAWQQSVSETSPAMRLHLSLAIRHAMLLRDEDLRGISYSDIFMDPAFNVVGGTQNLVYLMTSFHKGKTNSSGKLLYGVSSRHSDVKHESHQILMTPIGSVQSSFTLGPTGASEAKMLRIRREDIKKAGRWVHQNSKLDEYYDDDPSYLFAVQMAGFLGGQVPFHLKRNEISPSLDLQRQIFPFIKTAFGPPGSSEYDEWQEECMHEMEETNTNDPSQLSSVLPLQYDPNVRGFVPSNTRQSDLAKQCFLKALLRLRRVILQDAAEYLCRFTDVESPLLAFGVFKTAAFQAFKEQVEAALSSKDVALPVDMHPNVKMVLQDQQRVLLFQGYYFRVESNLDYLNSRLGPSALGSGSVLPPWQSYPALSSQPYPAPSCQHAFGSTPALAVSTACQGHSEQPGPSYPRRLVQAPVPVTALGLPRWASVTQSQSQPQSLPQSQSQGIPLQGMPMPVQQSSMTMTTTATTTTTTATTTSTSVTTGGVTVSVNYRLGNVAAIWEEYQKFEQGRQKAGKRSLGISRKYQKQLNNKSEWLRRSNTK